MKENLMVSKINIASMLRRKGSALLMGILNVTTDSFYDGGTYVTDSAMLARAGQIMEEGGDIIDVGAVSTRPGAIVLDAETEKQRVCRAVASIRSHFPTAVISVDTFRNSVARAAVDHGADIINDISGGTFDAEMIPAVGAMQVPYVLMHTPAMPDKMQQCTQYDDIIGNIRAYFDMQLSIAAQCNVCDIILDPGFGFGKTLEQNYYILEHLEDFKSYGWPILVGISRKSMIYKKYKTTPQNALEGTLEVTKEALLHGADLLRIHDVAATKKLLVS